MAYRLRDDSRLPLVIDAPAPGHDIADLRRAHREAIEARAMAHGAVPLRGFAVGERIFTATKVRPRPAAVPCLLW